MRKPVLLAIVVLATVLFFGGVRGHPLPAARAQQPPISVVINEVAWAGHKGFTSDEWIELYNPTDHAINLTGWTLAATDGTPAIALNGTIPAGGYFLLERTDDSTVADIAADQFYSGSLENGGETLELRDDAGTLVDSANGDGGGWPAGAASPGYLSMERACPQSPDTNSNWHSNDGLTRNGTDAGGQPINGTPKARNSGTIVPPAGLDSAQVGNFTIVFHGVADNGDGTFTWTYSVTSDCATGQTSPALSHWVLELCEPAMDGVSPADGEAYTTLDPFGGSVPGVRTGIGYVANVGPEPTTGITGLKFDHATGDGLGENGAEIDVFQFTLAEPFDTTPVEVGTKAGQLVESGAILGPACTPTAVTLASFSAEVRGSRVTVRWETGTEVDNAGFNLYRAPSALGPWTRVNPALIAAQGSAVSGAAYTFTDTPGAGTFYYQLEDVDYSGVTTRYEPVRVTVRPVLRRPVRRPVVPPPFF